MHHCYSYTHTCIQTYNMTDAADYEELDFPPPPKPPHTRYSHTQLPNESSSQPVAPPRTTSRYVERDRKVSGWALHVNDNGTSLYTEHIVFYWVHYGGMLSPVIIIVKIWSDKKWLIFLPAIFVCLCLYSLTSHCGSLCAVMINQPLLPLLPNQPRDPSLRPNQGLMKPSIKRIDPL